MSLEAQYRSAQRSEQRARLTRLLTLRALVAIGLSQRQTAERLGVSQPAVSQQLARVPNLAELSAGDVLHAAAPVFLEVAAEFGFSRLAVFGSVARGDAGQGSDIDLLVEPPLGASTFDFLRFRQILTEIVGRDVDLVSYAGLRTDVDADVIREAVPL